MRFTNKFPYTNINNINLDWIIKRVKELGETVLSYAADIANAVALAEAAQEAADSVTATAESAMSTAQAAEATANAIAGTANNALTTAQAAEATANAIAGTANNALTTAQAAETTAQAAEEIAQAAEEIAQAAEETANNAETIAGTASANASNAGQTANTALATAQAANTTAQAAETTAQAAETTAQAAETAAQAAETTASNALQTANTALAKAESALDEKAGALIMNDTGAVVSFVPDRTIEQNLSVSVDIESMQAGSGVPSPDNVRPISGWSALVVERTGANLVNQDTIIIGFFVRAVNTSDLLPLGSISSNTSWSCSDYIKVNPLTQYTTAVPYYAPASAAGLVFFDKYKNALSGVPTGNQGGAVYTFTTPANCFYIRFSWNNTNGNEVQLAAGSESSYHSYTSSVYNIAIGQTVYGAKLTIAENGGVTVLVDRVMPSLDGATLYRDNGTYKIWAKELEYVSKNSVGGNAISNITTNFGVVSSTALATKIQFPYGTQRALFASIPSDFDIADVQACYELATPFTIQLAPVTISTITEQINNVWADAGNVTVEFAADLKWYIDSRIAELQALALENGG